VQDIEEGPDVIDTEQDTKRILQVGSRRVSSMVSAKARELFRAGAIGELNLVEAGMNRNSATGAWQYSIPPIRARRAVVEDAAFGYRAAAPALLSNESYFEGKPVGWDPVKMRRGSAKTWGGGLLGACPPQRHQAIDLHRRLSPAQAVGPARWRPHARPAVGWTPTPSQSGLTTSGSPDLVQKIVVPRGVA